MRCFSSLGLLGYPGIKARLTTPPGLSQSSTPFRLLAPRHPPHALTSLAALFAPSPRVTASSHELFQPASITPDPLGNGSNVFGTASAHIDYGVISGKGIWYVQVAALVVGHVSGLILAHDRALTVYSRVREATRSQYWMLVVMVGFTSLGLWLLSAVRQ